MIMLENFKETCDFPLSPIGSAGLCGSAAGGCRPGVGRHPCGGGAGAEGDYHPGCYPSLVAGSYPGDRLESHRVEARPP